MSSSKMMITLAAALTAVMLGGCSIQSAATSPAAQQQQAQAQTPQSAAPAADSTAATDKPSTAETTAASDIDPAACRGEHPLEGLAGADKLELKEACASMTGVVQAATKQKDGAFHLTVKPDKEFAKLVNDKNVKTASGNLPVIVTAADAKALTLPRNGTHVHVIGSIVIEKSSGLSQIEPAWVLETQTSDNKTGDGKASSADKSSSTASKTEPKQSAAADPSKNAAAVRIIDVTTPVHRGDKATVKAKVAPDSVASIVVHYKSGHATAEGLDPKKADSNGNVSWTWTVEDNIAAGKWPITVTTKGGGASAGIEIVP